MSPLDRRGNFASTAVWTCALVAIAVLTVWQFEIWPVGWVATETGTIDESDDRPERFAADPIEVAGPGSEPPPQVEPAGGSAEHATPRAELAALNLSTDMPITPNRAPPKWPSEPGRLPAGGDSRPLRPVPTKLPTGSDFAETGRFPEASTPQKAPAQQAEPASLETPAETVLRPVGDDMSSAAATAAIVSSAAEESTARAPSQIMTVAATVPARMNTPQAIIATTADPRLTAIDADIAANKYLAAHKALSKLYWDEPQLRPAIQTRIDTTAKSIYFDPRPHYMAAYEVQPAEQIRIFARQYSVPWEYLVRLNRIEDPSRIQAGQQLKVIKGPFSAVVSLSDFTLTIHAHGYYVRRYPVGVGKDGSTPIGAFHVVLKEFDPKYYGSDGVVMEREDPANPLGERWIGLDDGSGQPTSYGIHGTIDPGSIGKAESRGCVRLRNEDVAEVYDLLGVGSEVIIQR
ncbi:MAG: L,D-transpeptidase family protein [Planctomycetota bacterium]|nr:L,D-transpeptidase family protein [Planctomycetaceae bacterium]MDQ3332145.1 L,D-transpeptidase family protein [Planctomycetota bacterium]